ncbi:MAG: chorismate synthase [Bacteroidota bacterium]
MNSFGRIFRLSIFGESHGPMVGITIDGVIPGIEISEIDFEIDLQRRRGGGDSGTTTRREDDLPIFLSGIFNGRTTGAPLTIAFENKNVISKDYEVQRKIPRPGHADFVASKKFMGFEDYRGGGHFSGRLTVCLVAAGVIAKKILGELNKSNSNIEIKSELISIGGETDITIGIQKAIDAQDSIGGIVECVIKNVPIGLGEPFFDSLESMISHAVFAIPAVKGIEFGSGFGAALMKGSDHNDSLVDASGKNASNNSGGISGGISNGNEIIFRIAIKPTSSTPKEQSSLNIETGLVEDFNIKGRHDLCIALRVPPVLEAVAACVLADFFLIAK